MSRFILHIPDAAMFEVTTLDDMVGFFNYRVGCERPDVICLPIWDEGGPHVDTRVALTLQDKMWKNYQLSAVTERIRAIYPNTEVYFWIMANLPGCDTTMYSVRTQYDQEQSGCCVNNPLTQSLLLAYVGELRNQLKPDGLIFNIVDIHGQTAEENRIQITCFCAHCQQALEHQAGTRFREFYEPNVEQNPLNLVLNDSGRNINFIDIKPERMQPGDLIKIAAARGRRVTADEVKQESWAELIFRYARARSKITSQAIGAMHIQLQKSGPIKTGAITNSPHFDWTGGSALREIAQEVDEVWMDVGDLRENEIPTKAELYHFLMARSTYRMDNYFALVSDLRFLSAYLRRSTAGGDEKNTLDELIKLIILRQEDMDTLNDKSMTRQEADAVNNRPDLAGLVASPVQRKWSRRISNQAISSASEQHEANRTIIAGVTNPPTASAVQPSQVISQYLSAVDVARRQGHELSMEMLIAVAKAILSADE